MYSGTRIETVAELNSMYRDLLDIYANSESDPESVVLCPAPGGYPHPARRDFLRMFNDPNVEIHGAINEDTGKFVVVGPWMQGGRSQGLTAAWGPNDTAVLNEAGDAMIDYVLTRDDEFYLNPNADGWVMRQWFEKYMPQDGGKWDVTTYSGVDLNSDVWKLHVWRDQDNAWAWDVMLR